MKMKKRLVGVLLAGLIAFAGVPGAVQPLTADISAASTAATGTASAKLAAPKSFTGKISGTSLKLTWKKVTGADAYIVYRLNSKTGKYETLKTTTSASMTIKGLKNGTYKFKVAALVKKNNKYTAQTKSSALTVKFGTTTRKTAGAPLSFPAFGTSKDAAIKAMGFSDGIDMGMIKEDVYAYGGYKKINGTDCIAMLYFNASGKFFYGSAVIPGDTMKFSKLYSDLKSLNGKPDVNIEAQGMELYEWIDSKNESFIGAFGSDESKIAVYLVISVKLAPDSIKNSGNVDIASLVDALNSLA